MAYSEIYEEKMRNKDYSKVSISEVAGRLQDKYGYSDNIIEVSNGVNIDFQLKEKIGVTEKGSKTISVIETNGDDIGYYANIKGSYYKIKIGEKNVELEETESLPGDVSKMKLEIESPSDGDIAKVKAQNSLLEVTGVKKGDTTVKVKLTVGSKEKEQTIKIGVYKGSGNLADVAEIGDYVDIGIEYENVIDSQTEGISNATANENPLTGWRVLNKDDGNIALISAGCPLTYYHNSKGAEESIKNLENLYKEINLVKGNTNGFMKNGFGNNNLKTVFNNSIYVDLNKSIHAFGCGDGPEGKKTIKATRYEPLDEVERLYEAITGDSKKIKDLYGIKVSTDSLFCIGQYYYLGGCSGTEESLLYVSYAGGMFLSENADRGIRVVVYLENGVRVDSNNTGSGLSSKSALKLR